MTIDEAVASHNFGRASAAKRGRNSQWPYVPIIDHGEQKIGVHRTRTEQIRAKAFATRGEAVDYAAKIIDARRITLARNLADPGYRALRSQYGLPTEIGVMP
jgi:hypothetical protein